MTGPALNRADLHFERPEKLSARRPAEDRGVERDAGRLLVSKPGGHEHAQFVDLPRFLRPGDLLVANASATLPASLPAEGQIGPFTLNLSTDFGGGLWLAEPRWDADQPGPLPGLRAGQMIQAGGIQGRLVRSFPKLERLWFVRFKGDVREAMFRSGRPIRYGYLDGEYGLKHYQTIFASEPGGAEMPGSAEMPSAAYPFTRRVLDALHDRGVEIACIVLHTGVSSLEVEVEDVADHPLTPEPFKVPAATARAVNRARAEGRRVIALGSTAVKALESAWDGRKIRALSGFTRLFIHPGQGLRVVDGLLTGFHDPVTSHLAMLYSFAGKTVIDKAYAEAVREGYHWHEFGDSHLILR